eukprot:647819_1
MWSCHKNRISTKKATWNIAASTDLGVPYWLFSLLLYMNGFVLWTFLEYWQHNKENGFSLIILKIWQHNKEKYYRLKSIAAALLGELIGVDCELSKPYLLVRLISMTTTQTIEEIVRIFASTLDGQ